jgi:peptide-methionine (S)-S-oxide reductase
MAATFTAIILRAIQSFIERNKNHQHYERYKYQTTINLKTDTATLAGGCFWCVEGQLKQLDGVLQVKSGYTGGTVANPTYKQVCTGATGHAEACNVIYDPTQISYDELLQAFCSTRPTQLNRQGNDIGTQYRSAIFYHNDEQKKAAEYYIQKLNEEKGV